MDTARNAISLLSYFVIPLILVGFPLYGLYKRVPVYESFVEGAKEGFQVAVRIIPYLVAILFAIAMFRASGAMEALTRALDPVLGLIGFPAELLPMAIIRSLSGSGSAALVVDMINQYGEDSIFVKMAAVMYGSSETTFYVIAVYFGAVGIKKTRHAVPAGLIADVAAMIIAVWTVRLLFRRSTLPSSQSACAPHRSCCNAVLATRPTYGFAAAAEPLPAPALPGRTARPPGTRAARSSRSPAGPWRRCQD